MTGDDTPAVLVARFLRMNNYNETLDVFLSEANLSPSTGSSPDGLTIEKVLEEKTVFDISKNFEKLGVDDKNTGWRSPAPSKANIVSTLPNSANVLHVGVSNFTSADDIDGQGYLLTTGADKSMSVLRTQSPYEPVDMHLPSSDSPILSCLVVAKRFLITTAMSGRITLFDTVKGEILEERRDHQKYVVKAVAHEDETGVWIATAAWDAKVFLYRMIPSTSPKLGEPVATLNLQTNPEAVLFIEHPEIATPVLLVTRRDSTFLYYYAISESVSIAKDDTNLILLGKQNLAPHSNAWIAFSPSALAVSPADPSLLAVATSAVPHMKLIIARMLLPPPMATGAISTDGAAPSLDPEYATQASQARAALALQDREAAAILIHCTTLTPQTSYSTPYLSWRPDASGVWVNGDDGVIRGIEASTGKIVATLKDGHEPGSKIRCLWGGWVSVEERKEEWVVSGGFDKRVPMTRISMQGMQGKSRDATQSPTKDISQNSPAPLFNVFIATKNGIHRTMTSETSEAPLSPTLVPRWLVYRTRTAVSWRQMLKVVILGSCCITLGYTISSLYTTNNEVQRPAGVSYKLLTAGVGRAGEEAELGQYLASHGAPVGGADQTVPHQGNIEGPPKNSLYDKLSDTVLIWNPWTKEDETAAETKNATVEAKLPYRIDSHDDDIEYFIPADHVNLETPRIGKVTILTGDDNRVYERAVRTHETHNRLHGYSLHTLRESILNDVWSKPAYILSVLLRELAKPKGQRLQWLLWVDADTIILNPYIPADIFLPPAGWDDINLMVCHDYNGLNNGIFLIRVHSWSVELLAAVISYQYYRPGARLQFRDQSAMADLLNAPQYAKHTVKAPQRWFNAYQGEVNETIAPFQVHRGDLLVHFPGVPDRAHRMELWLSRVEEHSPEWEVELKYTSYPSEVKNFWWEMAQLRDAHRREVASARKMAEDLRAEVQSRLEQFKDRIEETPKKRIEHEIEHLKAILNDRYMGDDVQHINMTVSVLTSVSQPLSELVENSTKAIVKECHELMFSVEQTIMTNPATPLTRPQFTAVEESISILKNMLLVKPISLSGIRDEMGQLKNKENVFLNRMADIKAKEDEGRKAKQGGEAAQGASRPSGSQVF